jgi:hypothetical protein
MMYHFRLRSSDSQLELLAIGGGTKLAFMVVGPATESAYAEELLEQDFGGLSLNPIELYHYLCDSAWIRDYFDEIQVIEGDLSDTGQQETNGFQQQPLGKKLVSTGALELKELEDLLSAYRPFAQSERFGEFLRLQTQIPPALLDFLLNPELHGARGFNDQRLGERLVSMGCVSREQLDQALLEQRRTGRRIGEVLSKQGLISAEMARFFAEARVSSDGEIEYEAG